MIFDSTYSYKVLYNQSKTLSLAQRMIQILQGGSPKDSFFKRFKKHTPKQVLFLGTENSGKKTIFDHITTLNVPLDIIALSNSTPITTYKNFLFDTKYLIIVIDSTKVTNLKYLNHIKSLIENLVTKECEKLLILLNKHDLLQIETTRVLEKRLKLYSLTCEWLIVPCCAIGQGYGISEGVNWLLI